MLSPDFLPITTATLSTVALAAFDAVAVVAALPAITAELGSVEAFSWVITSFLVASSIAVIVAGPLIDTFGLRTTFRATVLVFGGASVACALAPSVPVLVAFRVLQGIGGGLALAVSLAAIGLVYPPRLVPRAFAANSIVWGGMAIAGPALAAALVATVGWRAIFLVNVPLCSIAAVLAWHRFPGPSTTGERFHLDARGILLVTIFTMVSLVGLSSVAWRSLAALAIALAVALLYWVHSGRARAPVLQRRFFATMPFVGINIASAAVFGAALGLTAYLPLYVTGGLGRTRAVAAISVLFLSAGWAVGSVLVSRILDRVAESTATLVGYGFVTSGMTLGLLFYSTTTPLPFVFAFAVVEGLGIGLISTSMLTLLQTTTDAAGIGRANAAHQYMRNLGYTYSAAVVASVVLLVVRNRVGEVERVRRLLEGKGVHRGAEVQAAVASGFRWAHIAALAIVMVGLGAAGALRRHLSDDRRNAPSDSSAAPTTQE